MPRIVSIWLESWPIARFLRAQSRRQARAQAGNVAAPAEAVDPRRPFVLVAPGKGGPRLVALNRAAAASGLAVGELLSNARAKVLDLQSREADPAADDAALARLALWCLRYTPLAAPWQAESGADGLFLDVTGCAHLFGGEESLLTDLDRRLRRFGLRPRLAIADTAGAGWALARHGKAARVILPAGEAAAALADLPPAALRLDAATLLLLRRLGFRRIGELIGQPRAPLAARFGAALLDRLDQALGRAPEPLSPLLPPPVYRVEAPFVEAITTTAHVVEAARRLLQDLARTLTADGVGLRRLRLLLFRLDGAVRSLELGLAAPSQDAAHMAKLIALRFDRLPAGLEADCGFDAAAIHVLAAERMPERQALLGLDDGEAAEPAGLAPLLDRLAQRLGAGAVRRLLPRQSHIPERAVLALPASNISFPPPPAQREQSKRVPLSTRAAGGEGRVRGVVPQTPLDPLHGTALTPTLSRKRERGTRSSNDPTSVHNIASDWTVNAHLAARPLLLLPRPEPAEVIAEVPEGPPRQFRWRGVLHPVVEAEGPERIAPEWWRQIGSAEGERERDYYILEDAASRRFWLFRAGLYDQGETTPRWFLHGFFP